MAFWVGRPLKKVGWKLGWSGGHTNQVIESLVLVGWGRKPLGDCTWSLVKVQTRRKTRRSRNEVYIIPTNAYRHQGWSSEQPTPF